MSKRSTYATKRSASAADLDDDDDMPDLEVVDHDDDDDDMPDHEVDVVDLDESHVTWWVVAYWWNEELGEWQEDWWRAWSEWREDGSLVWVV